MGDVKLLVVDTSVALHLLPNATPAVGQEEDHRDALRLYQVPTKEWRLAMPTPVLGEVLARVPRHAQELVAQILATHFELLTLDYEAALVVGAIALQGLRDRPRGKNDPTRHQVKVDIEIVACAVRWRAEGLCTSDTHQHSLARMADTDLLVGRPLTFVPAQLDWTDDEKLAAAEE